MARVNNLVLFFLGLVCFSWSSGSATMFNVDDYGAKGDGTSDDTQAFEKAWKKACSTSGSVLSVTSSKTYLLKPITFAGPCKLTITVEIDGKLLASNDRSDYNKTPRHWILFENINHLVVQGGGTIDGNGKIWWENSCKVNKKNTCKDAPTAVTFYKCNDLVVKSSTVQNAQQMHVVFEKCKNVRASGLTVSAPESSPNTDGIHVTSTQNIHIADCDIGTGDDCISIVNGTKKVRATDINCGPGHGISIGSLGAKTSKAYVSDVIVSGATFSGTTNGVRIKTWQGGSGTASGIKFQNLTMKDVKYPIIIDQFYCDQDEACQVEKSAVQVENVTYQNISGTSSSEDAVVFNCSSSVPCKGIVMQNVDLVREDGNSARAVCNNVKLTKIGTVIPSC